VREGGGALITNHRLTDMIVGFRWTPETEQWLVGAMSQGQTNCPGHIMHCTTVAQ
jgi:hypothetical protein